MADFDVKEVTVKVKLGALDGDPDGDLELLTDALEDLDFPYVVEEEE